MAERIVEVTSADMNTDNSAKLARKVGRPFVKGQSGNLSGRPKKDRELTAALEVVVSKTLLAKKLWEMVRAGDLAAIKYVYDRIEGSPTQRHQFDIEEVRAEARRLARELGLDEDAVLSEAEEIIRGGP